MAIDHSILVASASGNPNPTGISFDPYQPSPTPSNPWICRFPCQQAGHTDTVWMYYDGEWFSVTDGATAPNAGPNNTPIYTPNEMDDLNFGEVIIHYDPPIDGQ